MDQIAKAAQEQSQAMGQITTSVYGMNTLTHQVSEATQRQAQETGHVLQRFEAMTRRIQQVSSETDDQASSAESLVQVVRTISQSAHENTQIIEQVAQTSDRFKSQSRHLLELIASIQGHEATLLVPEARPALPPSPRP
ncbi:hypothetical protein D3C87_1763680 [compost metagenome]